METHELFWSNFLLCLKEKEDWDCNHSKEQIQQVLFHSSIKPCELPQGIWKATAILITNIKHLRLSF